MPREAELRKTLGRRRSADRDPRVVEMATGSGPRSFLVQSVSTDRETFGYLMVGSTALGRVDHSTFQGGRLVLALRLLIERSVAEAEERAGRDLLNDALVHRGGPQTCAAVAARLGYEGSGRACVLAVRITGRTGSAARADCVNRRVTAAVREELRGRGGLVGSIGSETIAIVRPDDAEPYARRILTRLAGAGIEARAGAGIEAQVSIGISDPHADLGDLGAAHREAVTASALAERSGSALLQFRDLGLHRLLFDVVGARRPGPGARRALVGAAVALRHGAPHPVRRDPAPLLRRLGAQQMAVALSIHPSTLKYRLRRIREILDVDLTRPDLRFNIELALRLSEGSAIPAPTRGR